MSGNGRQLGECGGRDVRTLAAPVSSSREVRSSFMRCAALLTTLLLTGCYAHGWPFDDKRMCGAAYPQSKAECDGKEPVFGPPPPLAKVQAVLPSLESAPSPHADVRFTNLEHLAATTVRHYEVRHGTVTKSIQTWFEIPPGASVVRRVHLGAEFSGVSAPSELTVRVLP